jgi:hypothetical protein
MKDFQWRHPQTVNVASLSFSLHRFCFIEVDVHAIGERQHEHLECHGLRLGGLV